MNVNVHFSGENEFDCVYRRLSTLDVWSHDKTVLLCLILTLIHFSIKMFQFRSITKIQLEEFEIPGPFEDLAVRAEAFASPFTTPLTTPPHL